MDVVCALKGCSCGGSDWEVYRFWLYDRVGFRSMMIFQGYFSSERP